MSLQVGPVAARDVRSDYRRLLATLASRARWLGSRDPENAAQESLRRSLQNSASQPALDYYFGENPPGDVRPPEWPLDQLYAWLHGVLLFVVREERSRVGYRREFPAGAIGLEHADPADPAPNQLDVLVQEELEGIVRKCFPRLDQEYRRVLRMRVEGMKYVDIASRLGVSENTVATWVSRGIRELARCVRRRSRRL